MDTHNSQMSAYTATLIHDLKTPVNAQISAIDLLLNNCLGQLNNEQKEIIEQIKESCEYSKNLINTILDTYLYENGQLNPEPENFNLRKLIDNAVKETSVLAKNKSQKIIKNIKTDDFEIFADKFQIKRVIMNLISNAIKYGCKNSTIEIETMQDKNNITFNVKNYSNYISNTNKLFNLFQTDNRNENCSGHGLGLYLVKQIIKAHNGKVFGKCKNDGKCTFGFSIPNKSANKKSS